MLPGNHSQNPMRRSMIGLRELGTSSRRCRMRASVFLPPQELLERIPDTEVLRVTERAAASTARLRRATGTRSPRIKPGGRRELSKIPIEGTVAIGEGERDKAPMLFIRRKG